MTILKLVSETPSQYSSCFLILTFLNSHSEGKWLDKQEIRRIQSQIPYEHFLFYLMFQCGDVTDHCQCTEGCEQLWSYFAEDMSWLNASQPVQELRKMVAFLTSCSLFKPTHLCNPKWPCVLFSTVYWSMQKLNYMITVALSKWILKFQNEFWKWVQ